jgi:hypothetical protein
MPEHARRRSKHVGTALAVTAFLVTSFVAAHAGATPRPLPFTYTYETLPEGELEIETIGDMTPVFAISAANGARTGYLASQLQTEFEYGITNRLELGLYATYVPTPGDALQNTADMPEGNGFKQRLRLRLAEEGDWPVDVALYGELVENHRELELEAKVIVQRRIGYLRVAANLWGEREFYYDGHADWVLNPTVGATYEVIPLFQPGIEYWMRVEFPDPAPHPRPFSVGPHHYVGPAVLLNFGKLWWSTGVYVRASDFGRSLQPTEAFGAVWIRSIIGVGF